MAYKYAVYTADKRIEHGTVDAVSELAAEEVLYRSGHQRVLSLREMRPAVGLAQLMPTFFGVKAQDIIDFSRQMATLLESGISILTALALLEGQGSRTALRTVIAGLTGELRGGSSFSQALGQYPQIFSYTYVQAVKASEQTGNLETGLRQMAGYLEKRRVMKGKVARALAYPALVLLLAIGVVALLVTVALPPLVGLFKSLGAELPWTTTLLIASASFLMSYKLHLAGSLLGLVLLVAGYVRLPSGRLAMDRVMVRMPVFGQVNIQSNVCHICQTMSMLLRAGLRLPQIMDITAQIASNRLIRHALAEVRDKLVQGESLSAAMAAASLFPRLMVEMVVVGETTGTLDATLATLGDYYEQRVDQRISTLLAMIEPSLTVVIGLVVAFIALSMITPLYSILHSIR